MEYDDDSYKSVFNWISKFFDLLNILLFRNNRRVRRRNNQNVSSHNITQDNDFLQDNSINNFEVNNNNVNDEFDLIDDYDDELDEFIDLDDDVDRLLIERLFTLPNLWLHTELISTEYIQNLPVWFYSKDHLTNSVVEEFNTCSSSSSSAEYSDNDDMLDSSSLIAFQSLRTTVVSQSTSTVIESKIEKGSKKIFELTAKSEQVAEMHHKELTSKLK